MPQTVSQSDRIRSFQKRGLGVCSSILRGNIAHTLNGQHSQLASTFLPLEESRGFGYPAFLVLVSIEISKFFSNMDLTFTPLRPLHFYPFFFLAWVPLSPLCSFLFHPDKRDFIWISEALWNSLVTGREFKGVFKVTSLVRAWGRFTSASEGKRRRFAFPSG